MSLIVWWWWWCHCLGHALAERAHAIHLFSTVSFTEKSGELKGFDSTCIPPTPALPLFPLCSRLPLPVCHTLTPAFALPYCALLSFSWLLSCPRPSQFSCNVTVLLLSFILFIPVSPPFFSLPNSLCLQIRCEDSSQPDMSQNWGGKKVSVRASFSSERSRKWIGGQQ